MTQNIEIPLPEGLLRLIDERAGYAGLDRAEYIRSVLSQDTRDSLSAILSPFRAEVAASGITEDELDSLFARARSDAANSRKLTHV